MGEAILATAAFFATVLRLWERNLGWPVAGERGELLFEPWHREPCACQKAPMKSAQFNTAVPQDVVGRGARGLYFSRSDDFPVPSSC